MKMKAVKQIFVALTAFSVLASITMLPVYASEKAESPYVETHEQINFDNLNIAILNSDKIIVSVDEDVGLLKKVKANTEKEKLENYLKSNPIAGQNIIQNVQANENIYAIAHTDALVERNVDGHWERVKKEQENGSLVKALLSPFAMQANAASESSGYAHLSLESTIWNGNWNGSTYLYEINTRAYWYDNSAESGQCYPAGGEDFLLTAVPNTMGISYDSFSLKNANGSASSDYRRCNGNATYIQYAFEDDPFGPQQMSEANMYLQAKGSRTTQLRQINSYYIHTWKQMSLSVGITAGASVGPDGPSASVGLDIRPSIVDKQWQLYCPLRFYF